MPGKPYIAVVGGMNMDITGSVTSGLIPGDSNPGKVTMTPGGAGRNIAENIARLGYPVTLITALGDDAHTPEMRRHCASCGIDLSYSGVILGVPSGTYLCINDLNGDCVCAVSDMDVCSHITPEYLEMRMQVLERAQMVIVDANLPQDSLEYLCRRITAPVVADPVSSKKSLRLTSILPSLYAIKPNRQEAALLSGIEIRSHEDYAPAAEALLKKGVRNVFITLGSEGVYYASDSMYGIQPCMPGKVINTNGCGDAFLAASAVALLEGKNIAEAARIGQAASAVCASSEKAVSLDMRMESLENYY